MKKIFRSIVLMAWLGIPLFGFAQVTLSPSLPTVDQAVTITYDASLGNGALVGASKVYMHSGLVTTRPGDTQWSYSVGNWGQDDGVGEMIPIGNNQYQITITPRTYYSLPDSVNAFRLAIVFRNAAGDVVGKTADDNDFFIDIDPGFYVLFDNPADGQVFAKTNESFSLQASTPSSASIDLYMDNVLVQSVSNGTSLNYTTSFATAGTHTARISATDGVTTQERYAEINIVNNSTVAALPAGVIDGINYIDDNTVTLVLLAPNKDYVHVTGDFNSWQIESAYQMNKTPDGQRFWLTINGLVPQQKYIFQYVIDGDIRIADPYTDQVADPWNDGSIPAATYPGLIPFTNSDYGIASVLQTAQSPYNWQVTHFTPPAKNDLSIYELLIRDFTAQHSYQSVIDSMQYLVSLGINAIELMPVNEFEGNESWGYNPSFYFAPDKYYGPKNKLKELIDVAHQNGIAVVIDMVLNHAFGQNVMARMYWDEANNRPAADNPWFNTVAPHPCYSWGNDFNHESQYTQNFVDSVNTYWLTEYKVDGLRFDFTKGFTNNDDGNCGWDYDQSRINILTRMANQIWAANPNAYVILEHLTDQSEEDVLASNGMLPWKRVDEDYKEVISGNQLDTKYFGAAQNGGRVIYMESHDEERIMVQNLTWGNAEGTYNIKDTTTALNRMAMGAAFLYTVPGPKMMWMFGEQGYDYSINYNGRIGNKPIVWAQYMSQPARVKLHDTFAALFNLTNNYPVFDEGYFTWEKNIGDVREISLTHSDMDVVVMGNFGTHSNTFTPTFPHTGTWYNYFTGTEFVYNGGTVALGAGEWMLLTDVQLPIPPGFETLAIVTVSPEGFTADDEITITFDAKEAEGNLTGASKVYIHTGVVLDAPDGTTWQNTVGNWGADDGVGEMTPIGNDKWQITFTPRSYYNVPTGTPIYRLAMVFRDATGANTGKGPGGTDIFVNVSQASVFAAPSGLTASATGTQIDLSWADNTEMETGYVVERSTTSGNGYAVIASLAANVTSYSDTGLADGTYYYHVKATGSGGTETSYSNEASASIASGFKIYFSKPAGWSSAHIHYWNYTPGNALPQSIWPGPEMTPEPSEGAEWYSYTFTGVASTSLLFDDNGGAQTADQNNITGEGWYKDGVWYSSKPASPTGLTIHFKKPASWSSANMHYWNITPIDPNNSIPGTSWPGVTMTAEGGDWYVYTIDGAQCANMVFSSNGSPQTADLSRCGEGWYDNGWVSSPNARTAGVESPANVNDDPVSGEVELSQNYPNPFSGSTTITFSVPEDQHVVLRVMNILGEQRKMLINGTVNRGHHSVIFSPRGMKSGIYFYELKTDDQVIRKRLVFK